MTIPFRPKSRRGLLLPARLRGTQERDRCRNSDLARGDKSGDIGRDGILMKRDLFQEREIATKFGHIPGTVGQ